MTNPNIKMKTILSLLVLSGLLPGLTPQVALSSQNPADARENLLKQVTYLSLLNVKENNSYSSKDLVELTIMSHWCGNRLAAIDSVIDDRKISVRLSYDGSTDIYNNNKRVDDGAIIGWWNFFCPSPSHPEHLAEVKVIVDGEWVGYDDDVWVLNASKLHFNVSD